jgi:hypothetical protein
MKTEKRKQGFFNMIGMLMIGVAIIWLATSFL